MMISGFNLHLFWPYCQQHIGSIVLAILLSMVSGSAYAGTPDADVVKVRAVNNGSAGWTFHVTVLHPDTGWDDYCNGWDVVLDSGEVLLKQSGDKFTRLLFHPHETEQPFTRGQSGLIIPADVQSVTVRAHDPVSYIGGKEITLDLASDSGPGYTIQRQ